MFTVSIPTPTIPGLILPWIGTPLQFVTLEHDVTVDRVEFTNTDPDGLVSVSISNGVTSIVVTIAAGQRYGTNDVNGAVAFSAGDVLQVNVLAAGSSNLNLSGSIMLTTSVVPASGAFLTNLTRVKLYLSEAGSSQDALITEVLSATSREMERWMGRAIVQEVGATKILKDATGLGPVFLPEWPLTGVIVVTLDGVVITAAEYFVESRKLWSSDTASRRNAWSAGTEITVQGDYGYAAVPLDLEQAATLEVCARFLSIKDRRMGLTAKGTELGSTLTFETDQFLPGTLGAMSSYRKAMF